MVTARHTRAAKKNTVKTKTARRARTPTGQTVAATINVVSYNISFGVTKQAATHPGASEYEFVKEHCCDGGRRRCRNNEFDSLKSLVRREGTLHLLGLQEYLAWDADPVRMNQRGTNYRADHPLLSKDMSPTPTPRSDVTLFSDAHGRKSIQLSERVALGDLLASRTMVSYTGVCQLRSFYEATFTAWDTTTFGKCTADVVLQLSPNRAYDARPCHIFLTSKAYVLINAHFPQLLFNPEGAVVKEINRWITAHAPAHARVLFVGDCNDNNDEAMLGLLLRAGRSVLQNTTQTCCYGQYAYRGDYILWSEDMRPVNHTGPQIVTYDGGLADVADPAAAVARAPRSDHEPVFVKLTCEGVGRGQTRCQRKGKTQTVYWGPLLQIEVGRAPYAMGSTLALPHLTHRRRVKLLCLGTTPGPGGTDAWDSSEWKKQRGETPALSVPIGNLSAQTPWGGPVYLYHGSIYKHAPKWPSNMDRGMRWYGLSMDASTDVVLEKWSRLESPDRKVHQPIVHVYRVVAPIPDLLLLLDRRGYYSLGGFEELMLGQTMGCFPADKGGPDDTHDHEYRYAQNLHRMKFIASADDGAIARLHGINGWLRLNSTFFVTSTCAKQTRCRRRVLRPMLELMLGNALDHSQVLQHVKTLVLNEPPTASSLIVSPYEIDRIQVSKRDLQEYGLHPSAVSSRVSLRHVARSTLRKASTK